ncbi:WD repeat-containing protein 55 homolog [Coccinella septempunctata]|uniref:WD repeat-containing protein 55 homolog n=1 Tax=Coccinella septempunctata TaxID=41139 RepID=UPI001D095151|nr:WD repeat-containing protein 55 homolog [Coccinella septempunctata]
MCPSQKMNQIVMEESQDSDSSDSSISISDSDEEDNEVNMVSDSDDNKANKSTEENPESEEEDEVIKAMRLASKKKSNHPPPIKMEEDISTLSFHPHEEIIAIADVSGDVHLYKYSLETNACLSTLELHTTSCRDVDFSHDGNVMFSVGSDKSIMMSDMETQKLIKFYEDAHEHPINCISVVGEHLYSTGDDEGNVRLWDPRVDTQIYKARKNEDYISEMITNEEEQYLLCTSGDGSLTTFDLRKRNFLMQSEEYQEDLTCIGLFRHETKVLVGTNKGKLLLFNWNQFGLHSDIFPGPKTPINSLVPITENIVVTACDDGVLRATHLFPHRHLGIVGQHENSSVEKVDICNNGTFVASFSPENDVRFWNIEYFEDFDKVDRKHKKHNSKKEMKNNLPSSKYGNASDFFSGLIE